MPLSLYDTMAQKKRPFVPADPKRVTLYVCGPTVYNHAHIGNARAAVAFDLLFRVLRHDFGVDQVAYARNLTDIDDKIIAAARETGDSIDRITTKYTVHYREDMAALGVLQPTIEPTATSHIDAMIEMIEEMISNGAAYAAEGHVLFSVDAFPDYGALSKVSQKDMIAGARVEVAPYKKSPSDFVLWKPSANDEPGWESPWGRGRPGWHLECSAMIRRQLGETIDIHGGGQDLRFPHHENEIAQSACVHNGAPLARYWVHNGFLRMGSDKMSKSLGNIVLPHDLLREWPGEAIRWALLSAHYRQPLEWSDALLKQSKTQLDKFYRALSISDATEAAPETFIAALHDDLNTPLAYSVLHELRDKAGAGDMQAVAQLRGAGRLMGFFQIDPSEWFQGQDADGPSAEDIEALLADRAAAKVRKDYGEADRIRDALAAQGIAIEDGPNGATWRRL
ncbi:MAG: cysteine--tRNA ligase [Pseudomonadota bacterium]